MYYVYHLIDPRNNQVFYVGKGTGNRCYQHQKDAKAIRNLNIAKENRIREILADGKEIRVEKVFFSEFEQEAYGRESQDIEFFGRSNLTNCTSGWQDQNEKTFLQAKHQHDRMKKVYEAGGIRFNAQFVPMLLGEFKEAMDLCCRLSGKDFYSAYP